jgi:hypothetical protein
MEKVKSPRIYWQVGEGIEHDIPPGAAVEVMLPSGEHVTVKIEGEAIHVVEH